MKRLKTALLCSSKRFPPADTCPAKESFDPQGIPMEFGNERKFADCMLRRNV